MVFFLHTKKKGGGWVGCTAVSDIHAKEKMHIDTHKNYSVIYIIIVPLSCAQYLPPFPQEALHYITFLLTQTCNVTIQANVVKIIFAGLNFPWVAFCVIFHSKDIFLSELCTVIEIELGIKAHN